MAQLKSGSTVNGQAIVTTNDSRLSDARTPTSHAHGSITNDGKIGTTSGLMIKTTTGGVLTALAAGTSGQFLRYDGVWGTPPDTIYTHPANHPPSIITQDTNNRFVTDAQITAWNGKAEGNHTHPELHSHTNKAVLDLFTEVSGQVLYNGNPVAPSLAGITWGDLIPV